MAVYEAPSMAVTIYHNPRCSKSRQTMALLVERGIEPTVVEYLNTPPSVEEFEIILNGLGMEPRDLMRRKEAPYAGNGLDDDSLSRGELIAALRRDPVLMERPVVVAGGKVAIGRPPENVLEIL